MTSVKYRKLPQTDADSVSLNFESIFTYSRLDNDSQLGTTDNLSPKSAAFDNYESPFTYDRKSLFDDGGQRHTYAYRRLQRNHSTSERSQNYRILESILIVSCYVVLVITLPFSLLFCIKCVPNFARLVILRLGRLQRSKGPGVVLVLPCIDQIHRVDMRTRTFTVPPLQAVTADGAVLELAVNITYSIRDPVSAVIGVQDLNKSVEALVTSVVHREINKRRLCEIEDDKLKFGEELMLELQQATFGWGVEIGMVDMPTYRILKQANSPYAGIMKSLVGSLAPAAQQIFPNVNIMGGANALMRAQAQQGNASLQPNSVSTDRHDVSSNVSNSEDDVETLINRVRPVLSADLVQRVGSTFQFHVEGMGDIFLDLKQGQGTIQQGCVSSADVTIGLDKADLMELLLQRLSPTAAYMSGRLRINGDMHVAMSLQEVAAAMATYYSSTGSKL